MDGLFDYCIHTFRRSAALVEQLAAGASHTLTERRPWSTGRRLLAQAEGAGRRMPVLFSGADLEHQTGIVYWAVIDAISIDDQTRHTTCRYSGLRPVYPAMPLSSLWLRNGNRPVSDQLIRPYAICRTPGFLV